MSFLYVLAACLCCFPYSWEELKKHWDGVIRFLGNNPIKLWGVDLPSQDDGTGNRVIKVTEEQLGIKRPKGMLVPTHVQCYLTTSDNFMLLMELHCLRIK